MIASLICTTITTEPLGEKGRKTFDCYAGLAIKLRTQKGKCEAMPQKRGIGFAESLAGTLMAMISVFFNLLE